MKTIKIIGGGLAGTETAWQLASGLEQAGINDYKIQLWEMRPKVKTPAHHTDNLAELVCSNSLGSEFLTTARGLLIHEMQHFNSLIINAAQKAKVPAGQALAVDRDVFAREVTQAIENHPLIEVIRDEFDGDELLRLFEACNDAVDDYIVIATGPLTSPNLATKIQKLLANYQQSSMQMGPDVASLRSAPQDDEVFLHFFDAAAPIVTEESINMDIAFKASRYDKGVEEGSEGDYINCPFYSQEEFDNFYQSLISAERAPLKDFEQDFMGSLSEKPPDARTAKDERNAADGASRTNLRYFEGCMPVEAIAERGAKTLTFGPLKPVGLQDPRYPDRRPVAVVQLRQDNVVGSLYNMVGFQTNLKWGEQKRIFSMIPGLENVEIVRYGVMHQNIFINSPLFLNADLSLKRHCEEPKATKQSSNAKIYFAGQITGVEGYTESAATGIVVARSIIASLQGNQVAPLPRETMLGALCHYIAHADPKNFQPINSNWGLLNPEPEKLDKSLRKSKKLRYEYFANKALQELALCS